MVSRSKTISSEELLSPVRFRTAPNLPSMENLNLNPKSVISKASNLFFNSFFFDGKLYNYKPVEEDPGFVRMTLNY